MVYPVILLIGIIAATTSGTTSIDFTPRESVRVLDGAHFSELRFTDGPSDVSYEPPRGWAYSGEGNVLSLWDPNKVQVDEKLSFPRPPSPTLYWMRRG